MTHYMMGEGVIACTVTAGTIYAALPDQRHHILLRTALLHKLCILRIDWLHGQAVAITDLHGNHYCENTPLE